MATFDALFSFRMNLFSILPIDNNVTAILSTMIANYLLRVSTISIIKNIEQQLLNYTLLLTLLIFTIKCILRKRFYDLRFSFSFLLSPTMVLKQETIS